MGLLLNEGKNGKLSRKTEYLPLENYFGLNLILTFKFFI